MNAQQLEEINVFRKFAEVCPLPLLPKSAKNLDPDEREPDILCDLANGDKLTFELVSVEDVVNDQLVAVTKQDSDSSNLGLALTDEYHRAVSAGEIDRPNRFDGHAITVHFQDAASLTRRERAVPRAIKLLNQRGPGRHAIKDRAIWSILCEPCIDGPSFYANSSYHPVENSIAYRVKDKLAKHYESCYPIHLLAWSHTASAAEPGHWRSDLHLLTQSVMGPFDRIWVYSLGERQIVFDSATALASR